MQRAFNALDDAEAGQLLALRFGPFELDVRSGDLRRNGQLVRIQPQPLKVLTLLASRPGGLVSREEIQAEVWPAGTFVDFEQSLNFCIRQIRSALGDTAVAPRYLETLPKRGYRWVGGSVERVTAPAQVREWPRPAHAEPPGPGSPARLVAQPAEAHGAEEEGAPDAADRRPRRWRLGPRSAALGVAALAAALLVAWLARPSPQRADSPSFNRLTFRRGLVGSARLGPGGQVVFGAAWDGQPPQLHVMGSDPRDVRTLAFDGTIAAVSADAELAFLKDGTLSRVPLAAGQPKEVLRDVVAADWSPDGRSFAVARAKDGRFRVELPPGNELAQIARPTRLRLSPDGRHLAVTQHPAVDDDRGGVLILDRAGRRVAASLGWASIEGIAWAPRSGEIWFTATRVGADTSVFALGLDGRVRQVLTGMGRLVIHDIAKDGTLLLERATVRLELKFRREGEAEDRDLSWFDFTGAVALSPDGGRVLFYESGQGGGPDYATFLRRTDGTPPVRVGTGRACGLSPDGQWALTIDLQQPDHVDLTPTGPGEAREIRVPGAALYEMAGFVGDGREVFVTARDAAGRRATWLAGRNGEQPRRLPLPEGRGLFANTFSPDGTRFVIPCPGDSGPCLQAVAGGPTVPVRGSRPGWRAAGWDVHGRIYFYGRSKGSGLPDTLWRVDPASGQSQAIAELVPGDRSGVQGLPGVIVARNGDAWAYNVMRRLSELHLVTGVH
jgi:DNA-binding winged helix-turn-helix (wHTH) protein